MLQQILKPPDALLDDYRLFITDGIIPSRHFVEKLLEDLQYDENIAEVWLSVTVTAADAFGNHAFTWQDDEDTANQLS